MPAALPPEAVVDAVRRALDEDLGEAGDVTTDSVVPADARARAVLVAREGCVVAGLPVFEACFRALDSDVKVRPAVEDGARVEPGAAVAEVEGPARAILAAERTALNFLQRLSGIATLTREFVEAVPRTEIRDTRKTTPGLRALEKYAVTCGGGRNHRMGLSDAILIKDNHVALAGGVKKAVERAREGHPGRRIEVECETLEQVREAIESGADELLLDNMDPKTLTFAVLAGKGRARTEASGGITLEVVAAVAATGVDAISIGALTHSARAVDFSLEIREG